MSACLLLCRRWLPDGSLVAFQGFLIAAGFLGTFHIIRHSPTQGKFRQRDGIGTVAGGLSGGDQLIRGGNIVMDHSTELDQEIILGMGHLRPVTDVGT